jgi:hypothetical protein
MHVLSYAPFKISPASLLFLNQRHKITCSAPYRGLIISVATHAYAVDSTFLHLAVKTYLSF